MSFYALIAYIKYWLKAKTRHGIHSPFVYSFIEKCLRNNTGSLLGRIEKFIAPGSIIYIQDEPTLWKQKLSAITRQMKGDDVVAIIGIHQTGSHTAMWEELVSNNEVRLSIDIYSMGLLFVKNEFKEKQHFTVK